MKWVGWLAFVAVMAGSIPAPAQGPDFGPTTTPVEVHAFVSQGFMLSTGNNVFANSKRGSFEMAEVGLNVTKALGDKLRVGVQLFARDLGPIGNYNAKFDWFYLDYRFSDWLGIRAGRTKLPFGLYNEINDVDSARVPILLPQSLYATESRDFLLAQTGIELYGYLPLDLVGALEYRLYLGTVYGEPNNAIGAEIRTANLNIPYVAGGRLMWETPVDGLRLGGSVQALKVESAYVYSLATQMQFRMANLIPPGFTGTNDITIEALLWVASLEYAWRDLLLATEYSQWHQRAEAEFPSLVGLTGPIKLTNQRMYGMASWHLAPWLTPGAYYSILYRNMDDRVGRDAHQHDIAATLRFDITANWLVKVEGHFLRGTAALKRDLNDNKTLKQMERDWLLFLAKTTVYF